MTDKDYYKVMSKIRELALDQRSASTFKTWDVLAFELRRLRDSHLFEKDQYMSIISKAMEIYFTGFLSEKGLY